MWRARVALLCVLMAAIAGTCSAAAAMPMFAGRQRRGAVGVRAQTATLDCLVAGQGPYTVSWVRSRDLQILSHGDAVFTADQRVALQVSRLTPSDVTAGDDVTRHRLTISKLRDSDAGRYECQVNTEPKLSLFFHLTVLDEAVAEAAAEWAAERRAPPPPSLQSSTEAMQRDQSPAASCARRAVTSSVMTTMLSLLLAVATWRLLDT